MLGNALQIAKQVASELGLPVPSELVTSQEQTSVQMLALMNSAGNELVTYYDWEFLIHTHTILSEAGKGSYPRPDNYQRQINQTIWDKNNRRPAFGPVSPQGWQVLTNALISVGPFVRYRVAGRNVEFLPVPKGAGLNYNYQYISNGWVQLYSDPEKFVGMIESDNDMVQFDYWLMVKFLKLKLWQSKGLDTANLAADFNRVMDSATGQDHGAPVLGLSGGYKTPWLNMQNLPDGNWNSGTP